MRNIETTSRPQPTSARTPLANSAPPSSSTVESDLLQPLRCLTPPGSDDPSAVRRGGSKRPSEKAPQGALRGRLAPAASAVKRVGEVNRSAQHIGQNGSRRPEFQRLSRS